MTWQYKFIPEVAQHRGQCEGSVLLNDGRVLMTSIDWNAVSPYYGHSSIVLSPDANGSYVNGTITGPQQLPYIHHGGAMALLDDGRVLMCGGHPGNSGEFKVSIFNPNSMTWTSDGQDYAVSHQSRGSALLIDETGKLFFGAGATWNPATSRFVSGPPTVNTVESSVSPLPDGTMACFQAEYGTGASTIARTSGNHSVAPLSGANGVSDEFTWPWRYGAVEWSDRLGTTHEICGSIWMPRINRLVTVGGNCGEIFTWNPATPTTVQVVARTPVDYTDKEIAKWRIGSVTSGGQTGAQLIGTSGGTLSVTIASQGTNGTANVGRIFVRTSNGRFVGFRITNTGSFPSTPGATVTMALAPPPLVAGDPNGVIATGAEVYVIPPVRCSAESWAAILPSGHLFYPGDTHVGQGDFPVGSKFFTWSGTGDPVVADSLGGYPRIFGPLYPAEGAPDNCPGGWLNHGTLLPTGQVLVWFNTQLHFYNPEGAAATVDYSQRPTVTSCPDILYLGGSHTVAGTQLHGLHVGVQWSDETSQNCNQPITRLISQADGNVYYCSTHSYSYRGISPGAPSTCKITVPKNVPQGLYDLEVVSNGVPSVARTVSVISGYSGEAVVSNPFASVSTNIVGAPSVPPTYTVPSSAVYFVSPTGSNVNNGTSISTPKQTIGAAVTAAADDSTIVIRAGTYREQVDCFKTIRFMNYPGEAVWIDGSSVLTGWTSPSGGAVRWQATWSTWQNVDTVSVQVTDSGNALTGDPMMVFVNGVELTQVATEAAITTGTFFADRATNRIVVGTNPNGATVEVAHRTHGMFISGGTAALSSIKGINFRKFATPTRDGSGVNQQAAVKMFAEGMLIENCIIEDVHNSGLYFYDDSFTGATARNVTVRRAGQIGIGASRMSVFTIENCDIIRANNKGFAPQHATGGIKVTVSNIVNIRNNRIKDSQANGIWLDQSCRNVTIRRNLVDGATRNGIEYEICNGGTIVCNVVTNIGGDGIMVNESDDVFIWNNTITEVTGWPLRMLEGNRTPANPGNAGDYDDRDAGAVYPTDGVDLTAWSVSNIVMKNNVCAGKLGTSGNAFVGFDDVEGTVTAYTAANLQISHNRYWSPATGDPEWVGNAEGAGAGGSMGVFTTLASWQSTTGLDANTRHVVGGINPFISNPGYKWVNPDTEAGTTIPLNVASAVGVASGTLLRPGVPYNLRWITV